MLGSTVSIAGPNIVLNTIVAEELRQFADTLESAADFEESVHTLVQKVIREHKRIIFNGNNYCDDWLREAEKRGLLNLKSAPEALPYFASDKNIALFTKHGIFSEQEVRSRCQIMLEEYSKTLHIEALTMLEMVRRDIIPAVVSYMKELSDTAVSKKTLEIDCGLENELLQKLSPLCVGLYQKSEKLNQAVLKAKDTEEDAAQNAMYYKDAVFAAMQELRAVADELETYMPANVWPYPSYGELLYGV